MKEITEEITRIYSKAEAFLLASDYTEEERGTALRWVSALLDEFKHVEVLEAADVRWFDDDSSFEICWLTRHQDSGIEFMKDGVSFCICNSDENGRKEGWGFGGWCLEDGENGIYNLFPDFVDYMERDVYQYDSCYEPRPELMNEKGEFFIIKDQQ